MRLSPVLCGLALLSMLTLSVQAQTASTTPPVPIVPPIPGLSVDSCDGTQVTFSASKKDCPHIRYTTTGTTATGWKFTYRCTQK